MAKGRYQEGASLKDKKAFAKYLAEDEELVLASGYGANYLRNRFALYLIIPGVVFIIAGAGWAYYSGDNIGYGLLAGLFIAAFFSFLKTLLTYHSHRYLLTTRRVIIKQGYFAVKLTSALFDKITHIEVEQNFLERMILHHGTIIINTAGMNKGEIKIDFIDNPIEFKNLLERLINRERERFGGSSGPVVTLEGEMVEE